MNYFEMFGIQKSFLIDQALILEKYLEIQKKHHPDNFSNSEERNKNIDFATLANIAYKTLKEDMSRIEYLLSLENISLENAKNSIDSAKLQDIMDDMWAVKDIIHTPNNNEKNEILHKILNKRKERNKELLSEIADYFDKQSTENKPIHSLPLETQKARGIQKNVSDIHENSSIKATQQFGLEVEVVTRYTDRSYIIALVSELKYNLSIIKSIRINE